MNIVFIVFKDRPFSYSFEDPISKRCILAFKLVDNVCISELDNHILASEAYVDLIKKKLIYELPVLYLHNTPKIHGTMIATNSSVKRMNGIKKNIKLMRQMSFNTADEVIVQTCHFAKVSDIKFYKFDIQTSIYPISGIYKMLLPYFLQEYEKMEIVKMRTVFY